MDDPTPDITPAYIKTTPPPAEREWCFWCRDRQASGRLTLVDDTGIPVVNVEPSGGQPMCSQCGEHFHGSTSKQHADSTYVFEKEQQA